MSKNTVLGWHFVSSDKRLRYGDKRLVEEGKTYEYTGEKPPTLCECGMHASKRVTDAVGYAPGLMLCRVEVSGDVTRGDDKLVGRKRKVLWMMDATNILIEWAFECAERALGLIDKPDQRSIDALIVVRNHLAGKVSGRDLDTAADAAYAATYAAHAAASAAYAATYAADAAYAATYAAHAAASAAYAATYAADAAYAATYAAHAAYAATYAAHAAAYAAADAAYAATYAAERDWQEARLLELIEEARKC